MNDTAQHNSGQNQMVVTERDEDVLVVTLNRPEVYNALTPQMLHALTDAWAEAADPSVRAVVITGAGRGFCAGADLKASREGLSPATSGLRHTYNPHILALSELEKPVIAAVNGAAAGAGMGLAFAADIRIGTPQTKFVPAFVQIGLVPDSGVTYFLPRLLGYTRSFDWLSSGRPLLADEALDWGLLNAVTTPEYLLEEAMARAHRLAAMPGLGVGLTKRALTYASRVHLQQQLELEAELQPQATNAPGRAEARALMVERLKNSQ